jgi:hypothetical protein
MHHYRIPEAVGDPEIASVIAAQAMTIVQPNAETTVVSTGLE